MADEVVVSLTDDEEETLMMLPPPVRKLEEASGKSSATSADIQSDRNENIASKLPVRSSRRNQKTIGQPILKIKAEKVSEATLTPLFEDAGQSESSANPFQVSVWFFVVI